VLVDNDMTVSGDLTVLGSGVTRIRNGRLEIGNPVGNISALNPGDAYVAGNMQVGGSINALTISGDTDINGTVSEYFIINKGSIVEDRDLNLYFSDDNNDSAHYLRWDDGADEFHLSDDLVVNGEVTISNDLLVQGDATIQASLSLSDSLTLSSGTIYGDGVSIDMGSDTAGIISVTGDVTVTNDVTIAHNLSVAGTILGLNDMYVNVTGDTMTGPLYINPSVGTVALDVIGDIEYTGELKNQSPVKATDGLDITNFGGIKGGQILQKDVFLALSSNVSVETIDTVRTLTIPEITFVRYTEKTPVLEERSAQIRVDLAYGEFALPIEENEHIVSIKKIEATHAQKHFIINVGLDGDVSTLGEYKIRGQRAIEFVRSVTSEKDMVTVQYVCRRDTDVPNVIKHTAEKKNQHIQNGWQIVYLREEAVDEISAHDTAAMSPKTTITIQVSSVNDFKYSADTYIVAIVFPDDTVSQYCKIIKQKQI
jgi:hypothetical protein